MHVIKVSRLKICPGMLDRFPIFLTFRPRTSWRCGLRFLFGWFTLIVWSYISWQLLEELWQHLGRVLSSGFIMITLPLTLVPLSGPNVCIYFGFWLKPVMNTSQNPRMNWGNSSKSMVYTNLFLILRSRGGVLALDWLCLYNERLKLKLGSLFIFGRM